MGTILEREKHNIGPSDWLKLQIIYSGIKINSEILVIGLIYNSLPIVEFC
jgi:hypothetical protein